MLPSGYQQCEFVDANYIRTDVEVQNGLDVELVVNPRANGMNAYGIFGSRASSSNTSANQLNIMLTTSGFYFGYNNNRVLISNLPQLGSGDNDAVQLYDYTYKFVINDNVIKANAGCIMSSTANRTQATFGSGAVLFLGNVNTGGSADGYRANKIYSCKISQNGTPLRDYVPCIRLSDSKFGLYDLVEGTFNLPPNGSFTGPGGYADVTATNGGSVSGSIGYYTNGTVTATPLRGYDFAGWYVDGVLQSMERSYTYVAYTQRHTIEARFVKKTDLDMRQTYHAYIKNRYSLTTGIIAEMEVLEADIKEDCLQKSTSTFVVANVPSNVKVENILILTNGKGKKLYQGIIDSISNDTIVCREILAYFDAPYLFHDNTNRPDIAYGNYTNVTLMNLQYALLRYAYTLFYGDQNTDAIAQYEDRQRYDDVRIMWQKRYANTFTDVNFPLYDSTEIKNFESVLFDMFNQFGVVTELDFGILDNFDMPYYSGGARTFNGKMTANYYNDALVISDNVESIADVNIDIEYTDSNLVYVYNKEGTSFRQLLKLDGVNTNTEENTIPAKQEMIMSDDSIDTLKAQYISQNNYNHKISFTLDLNNELYGFDDFKLGRPIRFYRGNELFDSIITGRSYQIPRDGGMNSVTYTLGKARSNLTSKLNLKKVK